jgi:replicative DNA helicase
MDMPDTREAGLLPDGGESRFGAPRGTTRRSDGLPSLPEGLRSIPANLEAEEAILGSLLIDPDAIIKVAASLSADDFYREKNGWVYQAILDLHERREPADFVTLCDEMERRNQLQDVGGAGYITQLINNTPTAVHVEYYAGIVVRTATLRRLIGAAGQITALAYDEAQDVDEVVDRAEQLIFGVSERRIRRDLTPIRHIMGNVVERIDYLHRHTGDLLGVPSGFGKLDKLLGGFQKSDLVILAARPSVGKTALALNFAANAAKKYAQRVAFFSLEMSAEQLVQRLLSSETGINQQRLRLGDVKEEEWLMLMEAAGVLSETLVFIDDTPAGSVLELRTKARRLQAEHGLDLVVVDYLQLMRGEGGRNDNRVQEISYITRSLKSLARELEVPLIALSQLSRAVEQRSGGKPQLSDLRESGCLTGDSLVTLADTGERLPIADCRGRSNLAVWALNPETLQIERATVSNAFCTGRKPVKRLTTQSSRTIRATANHKFLTIQGWKRLDELKRGEAIAVPLLACSDIYWDRVTQVAADGEKEVYDLTVSGPANFIANDILVHNSIEQDADVVMFIYREDMVKEDSERKNIADVIVAKHRNGPTDTVPLFFNRELTKFADLEMTRAPLDYGA